MRNNFYRHFMVLTVEQALKKGVAAHNEGRLQEAERFYRSILKSIPNHPDANHNLGLLAVSSREVNAALPMFKTALETNPSKEQFWLSYIEALIQAKQFEMEKVFGSRTASGVTPPKLQIFQEQLGISQSVAVTKSQEELYNKLEPEDDFLEAIEFREVGKYKSSKAAKNNN